MEEKLYLLENTLLINEALDIKKGLEKIQEAIKKFIEFLKNSVSKIWNKVIVALAKFIKFVNSKQCIIMVKLDLTKLGECLGKSMNFINRGMSNLQGLKTKSDAEETYSYFSDAVKAIEEGITLVQDRKLKKPVVTSIGSLYKIQKHLESGQSNMKKYERILEGLFNKVQGNRTASNLNTFDALSRILHTGRTAVTHHLSFAGQLIKAISISTVFQSAADSVINKHDKKKKEEDE